MVPVRINDTYYELRHPNILHEIKKEMTSKRLSTMELNVLNSEQDEIVNWLVPATHSVEGYYNFIKAKTTCNMQKEASLTNYY